MGRRLKQALYGAGFLLFFSAVVFGAYALLFQPAPTCSDHRQNGDETGIDCGGPCIPCAQKYVQNVTVDRAFMFRSDEKIVAVTAINNPNDDYGFRDVSCTMTALDETGAVVGSAFGHAFIYDKKTKGTRYIVDTIDVLDARVADVRTECVGSDAAFRDDFIEPKVGIKRSSTDMVGLKKVTEPVYVFTREITTKTSGDDVRQLENFLQQKQFLKQLPDNTFDANTKAALVAYQKSRKITPASGIFGPKTRAKINAEMERITKLVVEPGAAVSISGSVKNDDLITATKVIVTGFLYDATGIPLGASKTELNAVQPTEERTFKLIFPATVPIDRVDTTKTRVFVDSIK